MKRFLATLLTVAMLATMFAGLTVYANTVTKTYFDINFENWTGGLGGVKNSDGTSINHDVSGDSTVVSPATVSDREGQVLKVDFKTTSGGRNYLVRTRMDRGIIPDNYNDVNVLWNEFSIKYEGGFAGFGTTENDGARNIVNINKNGQIALGALRGHCEYVPEGASEQAFEPGVIISDVQLELGKWYDIKVAADFTDAGASTGVPAYVWVNDELVANGVKISSITPGFPWEFQKIYFDQAANEGTTAYVDDVKVYETAELGEIKLPDDMVIKNHFDISFDNWSGGLGSVANRDGSSINHSTSGDVSVVSPVMVSDREGTVMKVNLKTSGGNSFLVRTRMNSGILPLNYSNVKVLWNEFSIKYEGGFAGFGTNENDGARNIVSINKNGQIALGAFRGHCEVVPEGKTEQEFQPGIILPDVQLELGKWYDIKVAADFTDANANSGVPAYVWVNDELVANGTKITSITPGFPWKFHDFYFDQAEKEGTIAYVDDVKTYETSGLGEIEAPVEPETNIKKHFDISFDNWTSGLGSIANRDGSAINHDTAGDASVVSSVTVPDREGKVMKVDVKTTSGGRNYLFRTRMNRGVVPAKYENVEVLWNEFSIKYEGGFAGFGTNEDDNARNIVNINKNGQISLGAFRGHCEYVPAGATEQEFKPGIILPGVQLELGKWYDIKVAADFTDEGASTGVPAYVWVNGKLVADGVKISSITKSSPWLFQKIYFDQAANEGTVAYVDDIKVYETEDLGSDINTNKVNVMTEALNSISANIATRNETYHPVSAMADGLKVGDSLYKTDKVAQEAEGLKVVAALDGVYEISSVTVTERWFDDNGLKVSVEIGKNGNLTKVLDNQSVNKNSEPGVVDTTYIFAPTEGDTIVYTFTVENHRWPENEEDLGKTESDYQIYELAANGFYVEDVEATGFVPEIGHWYHSDDNAITRYYINCYNAGEEISGKFFIASYDGNKLVGISAPVDVTLKNGANTLGCEDTTAIYNENYTYKAFIWDDVHTVKPVVASVDVIK